MYYVELLRVLRGLRIYAIILGIMLLVMVVVRVSLNKHLDPAQYIHTSRSAVKTVRVEKDGSKTTIIDDREKQTHVEVHQSPGVYRLTIIEKSNAASRKRSRSHQHVEQGGSMGLSISDENVHGVGHVTTIERNSNLPLNVLLLVASFLAAFMSTVLGSGLSKENEHLELAWTKPVSRDQYALTAIGIDVAGIFASLALTVCTMIAITSLFGLPHLLTTARTGPIAAIALLFPLSWYAVLQGMTASLRRASLVLGLCWPVAFALLGVAQLKWIFQPVLQFLNTFNPIVYFMQPTGGNQPNSALTLLPSTSIFTDAFMLFVLTLLGVVAAVVQWRRLEA